MVEWLGGLKSPDLTVPRTSYLTRIRRVFEIQKASLDVSVVYRFRVKIT